MMVVSPWNTPQSLPLASTPYGVRKLARKRCAIPLCLVVTLGAGALRGANRHAADYFRQGLEAIRRGAFDEAENQVKAGLKLDPTSPTGHDLLGIAYDGLGRFQDARQAFQEALKLRPDFVPARNDLGRTLYRHGWIQAATEQFAQV